jgi:Retinal pigment epithelial membrane protein
MLHGIWVDDDGSVRYRNRIVWTPQSRLEQQAGKALWAGLMTPYLPGPDVVPEEYANDFKPAPLINIVHHGGHWLALAEVDPPWEVTADLDVVGKTPSPGTTRSRRCAPTRASTPPRARWCSSAATSRSRTSCGRRSRPTGPWSISPIRSPSTAPT